MPQTCPDRLDLSCFTLIVAGNDTTTNLIANGAVLLAEHPDQRAHLARDPGAIANAVEEMVRYESPAQALPRRMMRDVTLHGRTIPKGAMVRLVWAAANRDEREFENADAFDVTRPAPRHLGFGVGTSLLPRRAARAARGAGLVRGAARTHARVRAHRRPRLEDVDLGALAQTGAGALHGSRRLACRTGATQPCASCSAGCCLRLCLREKQNHSQPRRVGKAKRAHHFDARSVIDGGHVANAPLPTLRTTLTAHSNYRFWRHLTDNTLQHLRCRDIEASASSAACVARAAEHVFFEHLERHFSNRAEIAVRRAAEVADLGQIPLQFGHRSADAIEKLAAIAMRCVIVAVAKDAAGPDLEIPPNMFAATVPGMICRLSPSRSTCSQGNVNPGSLDFRPKRFGLAGRRDFGHSVRKFRFAVSDHAADRHGWKRLAQLSQQVEDGIDLRDWVLARNMRHFDADRTAVHAVLALPMTVASMRRNSVFHDQLVYVAVGRDGIMNRSPILIQEGTQVALQIARSVMDNNLSTAPGRFPASGARSQAG